jgi:colicin import membrane protein
MRAGWVVSFIGHVGAVMMTLLVWETRSTFVPRGVETVPVDIVDIAPESNVRATTTSVSEEDTPAATSAEEATPTPPTPAPTAPSPTPAPRQRSAEEVQRDALNTGLTNLSHQPPPQHRGDLGSQNQDAVGPGNENRASLEALATSLIQRAMVRCWRMPADLPDPERLIVTVRFRLNRNGTLSGQPEVTNPRNFQFDPAMGQAVQTALRAVRSCDFSFLPSDPRVGPHYEVWGDNEYTFRVQQ